MADPRKTPGAEGAHRRTPASHAPGDPDSAPTPGPATDPGSLADLLPLADLERLSTLQILDLIATKLPTRHSALLDLAYLRDRVAGLEEMNDQARQALEK